MNTDNSATITRELAAADLARADLARADATTARVLEWAPLWDAMRADPTRWQRTTQAMFDELLGAVPPFAMGGGGFLCGEAYTHRGGEAVSVALVRNNSGCWAKYMTLREFRDWRADAEWGISVTNNPRDTK